MERIGRANVSNQPSIQLTLANLTIPRFAKKSLGDGKVQSIAWILSFFFFFSEGIFGEVRLL